MFTLEEVEKLVDESLDKSLILYQENRLVEADRILNHVLEKFDDESTRALQLLGLVKHRQKKYREAIKIFDRVIALDESNAENHNNLGLCYSGIGEYDKAKDTIFKAVQLQPNNYLYYSNIGHQYRLKKDYGRAMKMFKEALKRNSISPEVLHNIGGTHFENKDLKKAIQYMEKAVEFSPDNIGMKIDLAYSYQANGDWEKAWELYEYRMEHFKQAEYFKIKYDPKKRLKATVPENSRLVLYCEQGMGDLIQFLRFTRYLGSDNFVIECPKLMQSLLEANGYETTTDGSEIKYDHHCSIMSLPYLLELGRDFENKAESEPYLKSYMEADLGEYKDFKIGIAWAGNPQHPKDNERSCYLKYFRRIHDLPGVKLFSLQKDTRNRIWPPNENPIDLTTGAEGMRVVDMSPYLETWQATAAVINEMDLIITVDTAILHLAGALGKETWGLMSYNTDTRWETEGENTFWYPSVKIFRQDERDNWQKVFRYITRLLVDNTK